MPIPAASTAALGTPCETRWRACPPPARRRAKPPTTTSGFVLALKRPLFDGLQRHRGDVDGQIAVVWAASSIVDRMAQWTVSTYQKTREEIILRQQQSCWSCPRP